MIGFVYAVAAGFCAAIAFTCAKLAMSPDLQTTFWCDFLLQNVLDGPTLASVFQTCLDEDAFCEVSERFLGFSHGNCDKYRLKYRLISTAGSLDGSSWLSITYKDTGGISDNQFTGCAGLFGETLSVMWWLGTSLILTSLILIHYNSTRPLNVDHPDIKKE